MSNGGMDGFDWLQSFLPADSHPDYDPNSNNEAYQAHPAFHDAEEVARAALTHQQTQWSYPYIRSINPGTNHTLDPLQVYSQASVGQHRGNQHQESSNIQFNNPPSGPATYATHQSHTISQRPDPSVPPQHHLAAQVDQDAYRHGQTRMAPAGPSQRPPKFMSNSVGAGKSTHRARETTRSTPPTMRTNQHMAGALSTPQNPYQGFSVTLGKHSQMLGQSHMGQGITVQGQETHTPAASQSPYQSHSTTPVQRTHQLSVSSAAQRPWPVLAVQNTHGLVARPQASQSPHQSHSTISTQNVQRSSHPHAPLKEFKTSAAHSTLDPRQSITPTTSTRESSSPQTQNPVTNSARSTPIPPRPSSRNHDHVQPALPTAPDSVRKPATSQPIKSRSPSVSIVASTPESASAPMAPPVQTTAVPHLLDKGWTQENGGTQDKAAPTSSYQAPNQTSQHPTISQANEQSTPTVSSAFASSTLPAGSHPEPSYTSLYTWGPRRGTFSESTPAQQPAVGNPQSQSYPLPGPLQHQKKRWIPTQGHPSEPMPPAKMRRLGHEEIPITTKNATSTGNSVQGPQASMEYARPRGSGKILKNRDDLVQPIRPNDALPKKTYDPTTIARDVLIAAGKHPTEKVLNHHLEGLRRKFTKIDYLADLATFRWDLVDVKQPETNIYRIPPFAAPHIPLRPPPHPQPPQAAWHSLPRDPDIIHGHVTTRDYAPTPSRDTPPNRQTAMPTRIDARAPPGGLSAWGTLPFKPPTYHTPQSIPSSKLPSGLPRSTKSSGRPKTVHAVKQSTLQPISKPKPTGQTASDRPDSDPTVKSPEARRLPQPQVVIPPSPRRMSQKRRPGRPSKSGANHIEVAIHREQPVNYQIYPCKWEGCAGELHNIDSVRAHVIKVHIPHSLVCKWKDCGNKTPMAAADMFTHISNEHISQMAWRLGDGPTVPVTAENNPPYPSVLGDRSARKGTMVLPVDEHQVKAFSKAHGKSTEKTKAQALLEAGRHWKQQVGPEMDWSDRRLSTPTRQSRVHCGELAFIGED
ncbi:uncharacterized protein N7500_001343 [Penicillium coprophilum]|uniref:uncharacterized protein n=1 Tax=Penicillium coprophilum TaxID=36646 RepID=UPI0023827FB8|nr:uncharacterized protein N7500_001343 [Penicillium coprophilum]KAJ5178644.1 hypothetical protein N7500_001343 [Penicillium coprophilum]